jgi:hypothetical protein
MLADLKQTEFFWLTWAELSLVMTDLSIWSFYMVD